MARLFISQHRLDVWSDENRVRLTGDVMTLAVDGRSFKLVPAVRFVTVSGGAPDTLGLLDKVKALAVVAHDGGEHFMTSVIFGETAYDVQQGFLGEPVASEG